MIWTSLEAKEIDRLSSEVYGIPSLTLMEDAGLKTYQYALQQWKPYFHFVVLAGGGNNGGDALVVARLLFEAKFPVDCFDLSEGKETAERRHQRLLLEKTGCPLRSFVPSSLTAYRHDLIIIDGLLGIGLKGPLRPGLVRDCLIEAQSIKPRVVIAIDLPSGLDADAWEQPAPPLLATHTITFGEKKAVHVVAPSRQFCGHIMLARLTFAKEAIAKVMAMRDLSYVHTEKSSSLAELWRFLPKDAHKYDRGHVLAIGGSPGKVGAILMAAEAALKAGAGWVSVAPMSEIFAPAWTREFTYESFALEGVIDARALSDFVLKRRVKAILIGPGTMDNPLTHDVLAALSALQKKQTLRLIFDAGALSNLFSLAKGLRFDPEHTLLTPHPGEWARLDSQEPLSAPARVSDLSHVIARLQRFGFSAIFKSASPIILAPGRCIFLSLGDNRLARAGSGDVLAGLILGLAPTPHNLHELSALAQNMLARSSLRSEASLSPLENLKHLDNFKQE